MNGGGDPNDMAAISENGDEHGDSTAVNVTEVVQEVLPPRAVQFIPV